MKPRYRIMLVEDSLKIRASLRRFLTDLDQADFDIFEANNGVEALKLVAGPAKDVDMIVTDLEMPEMDGVQLIRHLRQMEILANVPILFLTSHTDEKSKIEVFRLGATDYVLKPFIAPELEARIIGYLERKRAFEELQASVEQARLTQVSLLPQRLPQIDRAHLAAKYVPTEQLGGDYYDFYRLDEGRIGILVADVSGHGISAALVSFLVAGLLRLSASHAVEPDELLRSASAALNGKIPQDRFATAVYAVFDPQALTLAYSSAGHPPPLLIRAGGGEVRQLALDGTPHGLAAADPARCARGEVQLQPGDRVLFHTDGLLEAGGTGDQPITFGALKRFFLEQAGSEPEPLLDALYDFGLSGGDESRYADDVTMILMTISADDH